MAKKSGVSSKTHTQQQLNDYANQNNPISAYNLAWHFTSRTALYFFDTLLVFLSFAILALYALLFGLNADLDWMCYSNPYDFD